MKTVLTPFDRLEQGANSGEEPFSYAFRKGIYKAWHNRAQGAMCDSAVVRAAIRDHGNGKDPDTGKPLGVHIEDRTGEHKQEMQERSGARATVTGYQRLEAWATVADYCVHMVRQLDPDERYDNLRTIQQTFLDRSKRQGRRIATARQIREFAEAMGETDPEIIERRFATQNDRMAENYKAFRDDALTELGSIKSAVHEIEGEEVPAIDWALNLLGLTVQYGLFVSAMNAMLAKRRFNPETGKEEGGGLIAIHQAFPRISPHWRELVHELALFGNEMDDFRKEYGEEIDRLLPENQSLPVLNEEAALRFGELLEKIRVPAEARAAAMPDLAEQVQNLQKARLEKAQRQATVGSTVAQAQQAAQPTAASLNVPNPLQAAVTAMVAQMITPELLANAVAGALGGTAVQHQPKDKKAA